MLAPPIYTSFSVPVVSCVPSATAFQWSADGQACFITKTALYIMTPDHGLNFDPSSALKAVSDRDKASDVEPIGWYRTLIQFDRSIEYVWPEHSQSWSAIVLGSVDLSLWAITLSPSYISDYAGCILAALTSSMDLTLWAAGRNSLKREWHKIMDVTPFLLQHFAEDEPTVRALKSQVVSMKWSQQVNFGIRPAPLDNASVLIAGTRAGMLLFLRYHHSSVDLVDTLQISDHWIICVAISSWAVVEPGTCDAYIAYALSDGIVGVLKIRQTLRISEANSPFGLNNTIQLTVESDPLELCAADRGQCTALEWVETPGSLILVYAKPGVLYLWRSPPQSSSTTSSSAAWSGHLTLRIPRAPRLSAGMSALSTLAGLQYIRRRDALLLCLSDGSFRILAGLSSEPTFHADVDVGTDSLSRTARAIFTRIEPEQVDLELVNRLSGMVSYDGGTTVAWVHEACRPADMSYKHDAKHNSVFLVARMWDDDDDEALLNELGDVLRDCRFAAGFSPAHLLRPFFFQLTSQKLNAQMERLLGVLTLQFTEDHSLRIDIAPWKGSLLPEMRKEFRQSLARHLYGWDDMLSLRMRLAMADFAWKGSDTEEKRAVCGGVAQALLTSISHRILRTVIRHLAAVVSCLGPTDVPFVLRMVVQSLLPGSPSDLTAEGDALAQALHATLSRSSASDTDLFSSDLNEKCPACQAEVPPQDITSAVCPNGHIWLRCSITTFLLATSLVRTCVGCSRKAFLPLSACQGLGMALPEAARGWVVEELLEAVHRCLFCGNGFVSVL